MRSNLRISQFPSSSEGLVSILNKITKLEMGAINKKKDKWNGTINKFLHTGNRHICLQDSVYDLARHRTLIFLCCFQSCDQQTYILWVKTLNGAQDRGFPCQSLNARLSWWHKLAIDTNISCIHLYIWEYVAMRKRFSKIHICVSKRLLIVFTRASLFVYGDEFHFVDNILLERPGNKTTFDFLYLIPNEHVFYLFLVLSFTSFSCSNTVKSSSRSAISAFSQLGH